MTATALHIVTWNVLADAYIAKHDSYGGCAPRDLEPASRQRRLCASLSSLGADVYCLQEVDPAAHLAFAAALPDHRGWHLPKGRSKPDGCSTFAKRCWPALDVAEMSYDDDTGCVALTLTLRWGEASVAITNTHLKWSSPETAPSRHRGYRQAEQLLADPPRADAWIVCGDLNAEPSSAVLDRFRRAGLRSVHAETAFTCNAGGRPRKIDFTLCDGALNAVETPAPMRLNPVTPLPTAGCPSDHLPVETAFEYLRIGASPDT